MIRVDIEEGETILETCDPPVTNLGKTLTPLPPHLETFPEFVMRFDADAEVHEAFDRLQSKRCGIPWPVYEKRARRERQRLKNEAALKAQQALANHECESMKNNQQSESHFNTQQKKQRSS